MLLETAGLDLKENKTDLVDKLPDKRSERDEDHEDDQNQSLMTLTQVDFSVLTKEGFLEKQSRHLKRWKKRYFVLKDHTLYSFKKEKSYENPTEVINLLEFPLVRSFATTLHHFGFELASPDQTFSFVASNNTEREEWLSAISAAMVASPTSPSAVNGELVKNIAKLFGVQVSQEQASALVVPLASALTSVKAKK